MTSPVLTDDRTPFTLKGLRIPALPIVGCVLLALLLQWVIAWLYTSLVLGLFNGGRAEHGAGIEVPISYLCTALATLVTVLYSRRHSGPSRVALVLHLIAVIIPLQALVVAQFEYARPEFADTVTAAFVVTVLLAGSTPALNIPSPGRLGRVLVIGLCLLLSLYVYGALLAHGGLGRLNFDLSKVYDVRDEFLEGMAPFLGYLVPWQGLVINPALMLVAFRRRSLLLLLLALVLQTVLFGMTGFRAFMLMPGLLIGMYLIGGRRNLAILAVLGVLFLIGTAVGLYVWLDAPYIPALLVDRVIIIPAEIHYWYYDFFGTGGHAPLQLSQSILAALAPAHYSTPIAEVIAWKYMGINAWANVGLFADAFANFGFAGCAVFAVLFAVVLKTLDAAARDTDARVAAALIAVQAFQLVNAGLLTTLLTHGMALAILILWAFPMPARRNAA